MTCTSCEERRRIISEAHAALRAGDINGYTAKLRELANSAITQIGTALKK